MYPWVPRKLTDDQKNVRVDYARVNLRAYKQQPSRLEHTVAIDETWVNLFRPTEKDQTKVWLATGEKRPSVVSKSRFVPKLILVLAMDFNGICYYELLDQHETVNHSHYIKFLNNLMDKWGKNHEHTIWLLDDNARPHRYPSVTRCGGLGWINIMLKVGFSHHILLAQVLATMVTFIS
ncbi:unnamed protein product [Euphydryas editha]|uniref:Transposase n=1 Tax=Euphydryas editha TaxID=104508 RepID=A0AAU9V397_EUPED|nr:unnamed protein product [Euphydryas editha]